MCSFKGWFGLMSCPPAVGMMHSWLPWCCATDVTQNVPVTCRLYWIRPHGQFAWRKACVRITARNGDCSSVIYQVYKKNVFFLLVHHLVDLLLEFFCFALFHTVSFDRLPLPPLSHRCGFEVSGFEVWSHSCMTNAVTIAVHLYAGWRKEECLGPNGLTVYWALRQGCTPCETSFWLPETVLNLIKRGETFFWKLDVFLFW